MDMRIAYAMIIVIVIIGAGIVLSGMLIAPDNSNGNGGEYDQIAQCLSDKGVIIYGSKYCHNCQYQKELFGDSFQYINYIECTEEQELCSQMGIEAVPTWIVNGERYLGWKTPEDLAELAGC